MTHCTFSDEEQTVELPAWATITQVSNVLGVSRNTVSTAVKRAWAHSEPWVKKEHSDDGSTWYLIDTAHDIYQAHQLRWKRNQAILQSCIAECLCAQHAHTSCTICAGNAPGGEYFSHSVLRSLPRLRAWLYAQGIQVFKNSLAEEQHLWQWRWHDLHGEGYASDEEAIVAALESQLVANATWHEEDTASSTTQETGRHFFFSRKHNGALPL